MPQVHSRAGAVRPPFVRCLRHVALAAAAAVLLVSCGGDSGGGSGDSSQNQIQLRTVSTRADLVTGGDVLVELAYPAGFDASSFRLSLNGTDVTSRLTTRDDTSRTLRGVIPGLTTAAGGANNTLVATNAVLTGSRTELTVTSYPITGPVLSGPQITPYECRTTDNGLGAALDANCSATTQVVWYYRANNNTFKTLADPTSRPSDLVNTTTNAGVTVPYIVRVESGTVNRGVYRLAILDDPKSASTTNYVPTAGWNRKLIVLFDCCGSAQYNQGVHPISTVLSDRELSRGFAMMNSTELWNNQHANPHLQGETLMMLKEYFIEHVGQPKWTAGLGGSGGAIQQYLIAQLFPGLLDGLQPNVSFPETMMPEVMECRLLNNVYKTDSARWSTTKQNAINGFNTGTCVSWDVAFASIIKSDNPPGCGVREPANVANLYNATTNPNGIRCDFFQTNVNLLGVQPGTTKARRPLDNTGIQYGLAALNSGTITVQDFLDLNASIGGYDGDGNPQTARSVGDSVALQNTYAGGFKNSFTGTGLSTIPIITQRSNADARGDIHDTLQDLIIRARLVRANGRSDNQIIWESGSTSGFDIGALSLDTINAWLDAIAADPAPASIDKVARLKPASATDACWTLSGQRINETMSTNPSSACNQVYPRFSTPRIVAGMPITNDILKCQLKPVATSDYTQAFSPSQVAQLNTIFPNGVCDWTKTGVGQVPLKGTYLKLPLS